MRRHDCPITIVIPVKDRADIIPRTLESIRDQSFRPLKVILVDNNSTDGTPAVLETWREAVADDDIAVKILTELRAGAAIARNKGLAAVDTEWTLFFDSDDIMLPDHISRAVEMLQQRPQADIIGWDFIYRTQSGKESTRRFHTTDTYFANLFHGSMSTLRYMAKTALFRKAGGWLDGAKMFDDCELGMRLLNCNPTIARIDGNPTVLVCETASSIMHDADGRIGSMTLALDEIEKSLADNQRHWVDLMRLLMALTWAKNDPEAPSVVAASLKRGKLRHRLLWRIFAAYTRCGGRGVARIYSPLRRFGL